MGKRSSWGEEEGMAKKKKVRVVLRKNRNGVPRDNAWTRKLHEQDATVEDSPTANERVRARGDLSRRRTIIQDDIAPVMNADGTEPADMPSVDIASCRHGRVLRVYRYVCVVQAEDAHVAVDAQHPS